MIKVVFSVVALLFAHSLLFATIMGSKHDLSMNNYYGTYGNETQVCVFCHTPHASNPDLSNGAIWNRSITDTSQFILYSGANGEPNHPSMLCLSCHDGVSNIGDPSAVAGAQMHQLINEPGSGLATGDGGPNCKACHKAMFGIGGGLPSDTVMNMFPGRWWTIGPDLSNDHPVSIDYSASQSNFPTEFKPKSAVLAEGFVLPDGNVECVTCHDPHNPNNGLFLRKSNINSAVCKTCHIK